MGFLSRLSGVCCAEQTPSGQLECYRAGAGGVKGVSYVAGGWVMAERWGINSSGINHLMPTKLFKVEKTEMDEHHGIKY